MTVLVPTLKAWPTLYWRSVTRGATACVACAKGETRPARKFCRSHVHHSQPISSKEGHEILKKAGHAFQACLVSPGQHRRKSGSRHASRQMPIA